MKNIEIILHETSHPGNIGAAARAMKTMAITKLSLIKPKLFPDEIATARASGATDILKNAKKFDSLDAAIANNHIIFATSARDRSITIPTLTPKEASKLIYSLALKQSNVAILFGNEQNGLTNADLLKCNYQIVIPTNNEYSSLNIAAAIQIVCYEIFSQSLDLTAQNIDVKNLDYPTKEESNNLFNHIVEMLVNINFIKTEKKSATELKVREIFNTVTLSSKHIQILRGILSKINKHST